MIRPTPLRSAPARRLAAAVLLASLGGCALLGGGKTPVTVYAPHPQVSADPTWPAVDGQLSIAAPDASHTADGLRIAVRPTPLELQVYKGASWAKRPSDMIEDTLLRTLEDSGRIRAVARQGSGIAADYKLVLDVRRFEADYAGNPTPAATLEVSAKLLHASDQQIVASRVFRQAEPAGDVAVPAVAAAFERALGRLGHELAGWTLIETDTHERQGHR